MSECYFDFILSRDRSGASAVEVGRGVPRSRPTELPDGKLILTMGKAIQSLGAKQTQTTNKLNLHSQPRLAITLQCLVGACRYGFVLLSPCSIGQSRVCSNDLSGRNHRNTLVLAAIAFDRMLHTKTSGHHCQCWSMTMVVPQQLEEGKRLEALAIRYRGSVY